jgi:hypothetical protein
LEERNKNEEDHIDNHSEMKHNTYDIDSVDGRFNGYSSTHSPASQSHEYCQLYKDKPIDNFVPWSYDVYDDVINESQGGVYGGEYRYEMMMIMIGM